MIIAVYSLLSVSDRPYNRDVGPDEFAGKELIELIYHPEVVSV